MNNQQTIGNKEATKNVVGELFVPEFKTTYAFICIHNKSG